MPISITQYFQAKHAAGIEQSRAVQILAHTQARLRNLRRATKDSPLSDEETWKHFFPGGVQKVQIARGVIAPQYEAMVNARRAAAGLDPHFKEESLHKGYSAAHPQFPAEMAQHKTKGLEYLRFMPLTDESGKKLEDAAKFYRGDTGAEIQGDELSLLQKFLRPEGSRAKQGGLFKGDTGEWEYAGDLNKPVGFRTFGAENVKAIREEGETDWTQLDTLRASPPEAAAGGTPSDDEGKALMGELGEMAPPNLPPSTPGDNPRDSDDAVNRGNASSVYRSLGSAFGTALGVGLGGGPLGGAAGGAIGGAMGDILGGGSASGAAGGLAKVGATMAGQALGGKAGGMIGSAIGNVLGSAIHGDTGGGGSGGGSAPGGSGGSGGGRSGGQEEIVYWLRTIAGYLRSINEGVVVRRSSGGSTM